MIRISIIERHTLFGRAKITANDMNFYLNVSIPAHFCLFFGLKFSMTCHQIGSELKFKQAFVTTDLRLFSI